MCHLVAEGDLQIELDVSHGGHQHIHIYFWILFFKKQNKNDPAFWLKLFQKVFSLKFFRV
jgi:hypothetical protein